MRHLVFIAFLLLAAATGQATAGGQPTFQLKDGDRVVFLGAGLVENDQWQAYLETNLQRRLDKKAVSFRYLGWSGDTVRGEARTAGYKVPEGLGRLQKEVEALKPTVVFLAYGMNESFAGPQALAGFLADYTRFLKVLEPLQARLVIMSPTIHEHLGPPFPDPAQHNETLAQYAQALQGFARERKLLFVDLFHPLQAAKKSDPASRLTTNGLLLTPKGYAASAEATETQLGLPNRLWEVSLNWPEKTAKSAGTKLSSVTVTDSSFRFEAHDDILPCATDVSRLRVTGLPRGAFRLKIDGQDVLRATSDQWAKGVVISKGPMFEDYEKLRAAVVLRNQLFYRRWRPYNDHSRHWGFIGGDFALYDTEIQAQEERIAASRGPRTHRYEISRDK
jgi:lysophospholipase L1-like esterase